MKKTSLATILFFTLTHLSAQSENNTYKTIANKFERNYNNGTYDSIFLAFSDEMQKFLPLEKTKGFLSGLKSQAGQITKREFVKFESGTSASYKTNFERALFAVNISVDKNSKINGLLVKPFIERDLPKIARNSTKLKLPFKDEWTVVWGGDTKELNYHIENQAQKNAFDIVIKNDKGMSFKSDGKTN
jgi:Protein of unknown function (DUF3887)